MAAATTGLAGAITRKGPTKDDFVPMSNAPCIYDEITAGGGRGAARQDDTSAIFLPPILVMLYMRSVTYTHTWYPVIGTQFAPTNGLVACAWAQEVLSAAER